MAETNDSPVSILEVIQKRHGDVPNEIVPTGIDGFSLQIESGKNPRILRKNIGRLASKGRTFASRKTRISKLEQLQEKSGTWIKDLAQDHDGLRGFLSQKSNLQLSVFPRHTITWDRAGLRTSLGDTAHAAVVSGEDLHVSMAVPLGYETSQGPLTSEMAHSAIYLGLIALGFAQEELPSIVRSKIIPRVDEERLAEMIKSGQVRSLEGAGVVGTTWAITTNSLNKS